MQREALSKLYRTVCVSLCVCVCVHKHVHVSVSDCVSV